MQQKHCVENEDLQGLADPACPSSCRPEGITHHLYRTVYHHTLEQTQGAGHTHCLTHTNHRNTFHLTNRPFSFYFTEHVCGKEGCSDQLFHLSSVLLPSLVPRSPLFSSYLQRSLSVHQRLCTGVCFS